MLIGTCLAGLHTLLRDSDISLRILDGHDLLVDARLRFFDGDLLRLKIRLRRAQSDTCLLEAVARRVVVRA